MLQFYSFLSAKALDLLVLDQRSEKNRRELRAVVNNYKEALVE